MFSLLQTASLLTWTCWCLVNHPDVVDKLREEINTVVGADKAPDYDDLKQLKYAFFLFSLLLIFEHLYIDYSLMLTIFVRYMKQVVNEVLRLYPPISFDLRTSVNDDVLPNGYRIPANSFVAYW